MFLIITDGDEERRRMRSFYFNLSPTCGRGRLTTVVDCCQADNEDVDDAASEFGDPEQRDEDPARPDHSLDEERQHQRRPDTGRPRARPAGQVHSRLVRLPRRSFVSGRHRSSAIQELIRCRLMTRNIECIVSFNKT